MFYKTIGQQKWKNRSFFFQFLQPFGFKVQSEQNVLFFFPKTNFFPDKYDLNKKTKTTFSQYKPSLRINIFIKNNK